ncbi:MAG: sugar phosphate isomerase/epimerase [Verrucomicrobia bacterium]|nr:sugar phosphate isomerase/epimerase [Verrucomicrobiota bacterium]
MNRRKFLRTTALAATATAALDRAITRAAQKTSGAHWPIGCMNRPWSKWTHNVGFEGIKAAGYRLLGLISHSQNEPLITTSATPEYLDTLKRQFAALGLKANMGALRMNPTAPLSDAIKDVRKQIDNAKFLSLEFLMTFGADKPEHYEDYYRLMRDAAAYSQERGMKLVLKPHGGASSAAEEILRCLEKVKHPNFKIWYDAGNIIHYTGKDPVEQLKPIAQYVTGFCAKDCARQGGDVMLQFGTGKVDFKAVFSELKSAGFNGPVMVECCALSDKPEEVSANARANREFLEKMIASI